MSGKTDTWHREMLSGTVRAHVDITPKLEWEPFQPGVRVPCPNCGKLAKLNGEKLESHYASSSTFVCR